ncbi:WbuC family cupin fold metalloprotein [Buttiauxella agrestis]|uniref:WbuC family cupin fold metalloprotein n=1 Tax=Buttiauxella agrestis TaxID=82977 RepID=UPI00397657E3
MQLIDKFRLSNLFEEAARSERLRSHLLLHNSYQDRVQRLIIAMVQGSYVEPHYHVLPHQWEMFSVLEGVINVTLHAINGEIISSFDAGPEEDVSLIEFAPGDIHSIECISPSALLLEIKEGPFDPEYAKAFPKW